MNYTTYTCPVCREQLIRDLPAFLDHTNQHIYEVVRKDHPELVAQDGTCVKCEDFVQSQFAA